MATPIPQNIVEQNKKIQKSPQKSLLLLTEPINLELLAAVPKQSAIILATAIIIKNLPYCSMVKFFAIIGYTITWTQNVDRATETILSNISPEIFFLFIIYQHYFQTNKKNKTETQ